MPLQPRMGGRVKVRAQHSRFSRHFILQARDLIELEETAGGPLLIAAVLALIAANTPWAESYQAFWETQITLDLQVVRIEQSLAHGINDFLLPVFFFLIGLELKRELVQGDLSNWRAAAMPLATALGGMLVPVGFYLAINLAAGGPMQGWAVPVATDVAFALAVLAVLGDRVPRPLKVLVLAFAAVDDIGGVLAIAFFYSHGVSWTALGIAAGLLLVFGLLVVFRVRSEMLYLVLGLVFLLAFFESGVHTTIAGVILGLLVPTRPSFDPRDFVAASQKVMTEYHDVERGREPMPSPREQTGEGLVEREELDADLDALLGQMDELVSGTESPVDKCTRAVVPWVNYLVLPLFALCNAAIPLSGAMLGQAVGSLAAWGVFAGLLIGKPLGIISFGLLAQKLKLATLPPGVERRHLVGMGFAAGIGFTVSLFIANLAFPADGPLTEVKLAVVAASALSGALALLVLSMSTKKSDAVEPNGRAVSPPPSDSP